MTVKHGSINEGLANNCRYGNIYREQRLLNNMCRMLRIVFIGTLVAWISAIWSLYLSVPTVAQSGKPAHGRSASRVVAANERLLAAAEIGSLHGVRDAITDGANVNATEENGWTALMLAARDGRSSIVRFLLARGADPRHRSRLYSDTDALELAVWSGSISTTRLLLDTGIDVNEKDEDGEAAIDAAGNTNLPPYRVYEIVHFLIRRGAIVDVSDRLGNTPLALTESAERFDPGLSRTARLLKRALQDEQRRERKHLGGMRSLSNATEHPTSTSRNYGTRGYSIATHNGSASKSFFSTTGVRNMHDLAKRVITDRKITLRQKSDGQHN